MPRALAALSLVVLVAGPGAGHPGASVASPATGMPAVPAASTVVQTADAAALFDRGVTFEDFLASASAQRDRWEANAARARPAGALVARLRAVSADLRILAIAEAACSDSVSTVPYLAKLAAEAGVPLRIVGRDLGLPIMQQHRTPDDRPATPTIVLLRGAAVAGVWVERPSALQDWFLGPAGQALSPQERVSRKMSWYDWDRGDSTVAEIVALAETPGAGAAPAGGR
ncbi:MAG: thioredoxin family protein [Vicinamibacterales bacterium]